MFHVRDDFPANAPISIIPVSWFNKVGKFLNNLIGDTFIDVDKTSESMPTIRLNPSATQGAVGIPATKGSFEIESHEAIEQDKEVIWSVGDGRGCVLQMLYNAEGEEGLYHKLYSARLTISKLGTIVKIETVEHGGVSITA